MSRERQFNIVSPKAQVALDRLTDKQRSFVLLYILGGETASGAAKKAGYAGNAQGRKILKIPAIENAIALLQRKEENEVMALREATIQRLNNTAEEFAESADPLERKLSMQADSMLIDINGWTAPHKVDITQKTNVKLELSMALPRPDGYNHTPPEVIEGEVVRDD